MGEEFFSVVILAGLFFAFQAGKSVGRRDGEIGEPGAEWVHVRRGSSYREVARGTLQNSSGKLFQEGDRLVAYQSTDDGRVWLRWEPEFEDGRFRRLP